MRFVFTVSALLCIGYVFGQQGQQGQERQHQGHQGNQGQQGQQQQTEPTSDLKAVRFDHVTYKTPVLDPATKFYSELLQMPLTRHIPNDTDYLGVGADSFFGLQINDPAYIDHFCFGLDSFTTDHVIATLKDFNMTASGIYENTLRFEDPNGLHIQLCNGDYAQNQTWDLDPSKQIPTEFNDLQAVTIDHITIKVPDLEATSLFYQKLFNLPLMRVIPGDTHYLGVRLIQML
jgi:catechol 2,3-dioxygenase-like lactoylglutathione lyase family enzyme